MSNTDEESVPKSHHKHYSLFNLDDFICLDFLAKTIEQVTWMLQHYPVHLPQKYITKPLNH